MDLQRQLWSRLVNSNREYIAAVDAFFAGVDAPEEFIARGLNGSVIEVITSLGLLSRLPTAKAFEMFDQLVGLCISQKFSFGAKQIISKLPREGVLARLEDSISRLTPTLDNIDFLMLLGFVGDLDSSLAIKLAKQAAASSDYDIREVGEDYLRESSDPYHP